MWFSAPGIQFLLEGGVINDLNNWFCDSGIPFLYIVWITSPHLHRWSAKIECRTIIPSQKLQPIRNCGGFGEKMLWGEQRCSTKTRTKPIKDCCILLCSLGRDNLRWENHQSLHPGDDSGDDHDDHDSHGDHGDQGVHPVHNLVFFLICNTLCELCKPEQSQ